MLSKTGPAGPVFGRKRKPVPRTGSRCSSARKSFGIVDAFDDPADRQAHLDGPIAAAPMAKAGELLAQPPKIEMVDFLAARMG